MNNEELDLNVFLVGAQKSATTSFYSWLAQHPEICAPMSMKDFPFFARQSNFEKGLDLIRPAYREAGCEAEKIRMQGCVQYMFYEEAMNRIAEFAPGAKILAILRDPVERALSAYRYFSKMKLEEYSFAEALALEEERLASPDFRIVSELTYLSHGRYGKQLSHIYERFPKDQVLVILYSEVKNHPERAVHRAFRFLGVDPGFKPEFDVRNQTGSVRSQWIQKVAFGKNPLRQKLVRFLDPIFPIHQRNKWRLRFKEWNTRAKSPEKPIFSDEERRKLLAYYKEDIALLEQLTGYDLKEWKK